MEEFILGDLKDYIDQCISFKELTDEFYLFTNQAYTIKMVDNKSSLVPDGKKTEELLVMINPFSKEVIGNAVIYQKLRTLEGFIINSRYRRLGYGEKFIRFCISQFKINNLEVLTDNTPAIKLYQKCGFKVYKTVTEGKSKLYKMKLVEPLSSALEEYYIQ